MPICICGLVLTDLVKIFRVQLVCALKLIRLSVGPIQKSVRVIFEKVHAKFS